MGNSKTAEFKSDERILLSKNKFIERLTRNHISVPIIIFSVYSSVLLYWGIVEKGVGSFQILGLFFLGILVFSLLEYLMHRYLFHMVTSTRFQEKMQFAMHGLHHEQPKDKYRLAMPPVASLTLATLFLFLYISLMGDNAFGFTPGFLMGYAGYLSVHYIVHAFQPPKNFFRILWVHHGIHHYKDHERAFGVSSPLWDYVFGTMPK